MTLVQIGNRERVIIIVHLAFSATLSEGAGWRLTLVLKRLGALGLAKSAGGLALDKLGVVLGTAETHRLLQLVLEILDFLFQVFVGLLKVVCAG